MDTKKSRCDQCGDEFSDNEVVSLGGRTLCGTCKQGVVKDVMSGATPGVMCPPEKGREIARRSRILLLLGGLFFLIGVVMQCSPYYATALLDTGPHPNPVPLFLILVSPLFSIVGTGFLAAAKGRSFLWGGLGILSLLCPFVYLFLGRICRHCGLKNAWRAPKCLQCAAPV